MIKVFANCWLSLLLLVCGSSVVFSQTTNADEQVADTRVSYPAYVRALGSSDPLVRQEAAEALARLAAVDQRKLVEGYNVQEKNKKVLLALDWALYRMGKPEALFRIVRELDSGRHDQAVGYLAQVESPALLYRFLKEEDSPARITAGVLEALGRLGDSESLEVIKPFRDSFLPGVANAAEIAIDEIEKRLAHVETPVPTRPRTAGAVQKDTP